MHGINSTLCRPRLDPPNDLHRHTRRVLPRRQRSHLPPVRRHWQKPSSKNPPLPLPPLLRRLRVFPLMAQQAPTLVVVGPTAIRWSSSHHDGSIPLRSA